MGVDEYGYEHEHEYVASSFSPDLPPYSYTHIPPAPVPCGNPPKSDPVAPSCSLYLSGTNA